MILINSKDVPALHHLAVRQHTGLTHLVLRFLRLREEPGVK